MQSYLAVLRRSASGSAAVKLPYSESLFAVAQRPIEETASRPIGIVECVLLERELRYNGTEPTSPGHSAPPRYSAMKAKLRR